MLLCQNGGTCYQSQKCICPPEFKGVLCQQSRCEAGKDCNSASSPHLSTAMLLLCTLLAHLLATLNPHWATKHVECMSVCVYSVYEERGESRRRAPYECTAALSTELHNNNFAPDPFLNTHTYIHLTGLLTRRVCAQVWQKLTGENRRVTSTRKDADQEGKKPCQPLFPLCQSWSNVHQTKKHQLNTYFTVHFKGNGCCNHKDICFVLFFLFEFFESDCC